MASVAVMWRRCVKLYLAPVHGTGWVTAHQLPHRKPVFLGILLTVHPVINPTYQHRLSQGNPVYNPIIALCWWMLAVVAVNDPVTATATQSQMRCGARWHGADENTWAWAGSRSHVLNNGMELAIGGGWNSPVNRPGGAASGQFWSSCGMLTGTWRRN